MTASNNKKYANAYFKRPTMSIQEGADKARERNKRQDERKKEIDKAAKKYRDIWHKDWLPNVYAMPEAQDFSMQEVKDFLGAEGTDYAEELEAALRLMKQAKNLGSVMKLNLSEAARTFIEKRFAELEQTEYRDFNIEAIYQNLKSYIPVLLILTKKYSSVVANPPYMGQKSMNAALKNYVNANYPITKSDLMTIFMDVIPNMTEDNSRFALINLPSWLFLSSFEKIRKSYIDNFTFDSLLHMGRGIFGIDFGSVAFAIKKTKSADAIGSYFRLHERNFQHILYKDIEKLFLYSNGKENYNEKSIIGAVAFAIMCLIMLADLTTGWLDRPLIINEFVYDSFVLVVLGCFGIAGLEKFAKK
jgi:type II restriction/modification system DNA methylase subunit YeeA